MTDRELATALANAEAGRDAVLQSYLDASREEANDALHRIAGIATPTRSASNSLWLLPVLAALLLIAGIVFAAHQTGIMGRVQTLFIVLLNVAPALIAFSLLLKKWRYSKGRFALLLLAERGDIRALPLLASEWQARPPRSRRMWNEKIAVALTRLLDEDDTPRPAYAGQTSLRKIAEGVLFPARSRDLTETEMYLAVAILRHLHRARGLFNIELVTRTAAQSRRPLPPNRAFVREIAQALSSSGKPRPAKVAVPNTTAPQLVSTNPAASSVQAVRRL